MARKLRTNPLAAATPAEVATKPEASPPPQQTPRSSRRGPEKTKEDTRAVRVSTSLVDRLHEASYDERCSMRDLADRLLSEGLERLARRERVQ